MKTINPEPNDYHGATCASTTWRAEDVKRLRPDWTLDQCQDELENVAHRLKARIIELGWFALETLLPDEAPVFDEAT